MSEESQQQGCQGVALRGMIWGAGFMLLLLLVGAVYQALPAMRIGAITHPPDRWYLLGSISCICTAPGRAAQPLF